MWHNTHHSDETVSFSLRVPSVMAAPPLGPSLFPIMVNAATIRSQIAALMVDAAPVMAVNSRICSYSKCRSE